MIETPMPTLDTIPESASPVHLLLIASTKLGKSTYAAQAAVDGFNLIYFDADNGLSALLNTINAEKNADEIKKRVHYFNLTNPVSFTMDFLRSTTKKPMQWVPRLNRKWSAMIDGIKPDDDVWLMDATQVPSHYILCLDTWTSWAADSQQMLTAGQSAPLLDGTDQGVYGEAKALLDYTTNMLQRFHAHVIVQAHPTRYEIYDKPKNTLGSQMKQKDMVLLETIEVPISSSRVHGLEIGKRFNHIGWLEVNSLGGTDIDFTRKPNRVGGGPPNKKAKTRDLPFASLTGVPLPPPSESDNNWFQVVKHSDLVPAKK